MDINVVADSPKAERAAEQARTLLTAGMESKELLGTALTAVVSEVEGDPEAVAYLLAALTLLASVGFNGWVNERNEGVPEDLHITVEEHRAHAFDLMVARGWYL